MKIYYFMDSENNKINLALENKKNLFLYNSNIDVIQVNESDLINANFKILEEYKYLFDNEFKKKLLNQINCEIYQLTQKITILDKESSSILEYSSDFISNLRKSELLIKFNELKDELEGN